MRSTHARRRSTSTTHAALAALSTLAFACGSNAQPAEPSPVHRNEETDHAELAQTLRDMMERDQRYRRAVSWGTTDQAELDRIAALSDDEQIAEFSRRSREKIQLSKALEAELMAKQNELDRENVELLVELTRRHGFPDPERWGLDAPTPTPVLIHAQLDDWERFQPLFLAEAKSGRLRPLAYAAIADRKRQHAGGLALYGQSSAFDPATGSVLPPEIEDIEATNRARAELGLGPLEEYRLAGGD